MNEEHDETHTTYEARGVFYGGLETFYERCEDCEWQGEPW